MQRGASSSSSSSGGGGGGDAAGGSEPSSLSSLPWWLRATAEREVGSSTRRRASLVPERTVRRETCSVDTEDGFALLRCEEHLERFRLCADGQMELIESSTSTSVRPYGDGGPEAPQGGSGRYDDAAAHSPLVAATLGQMLDDFFAYASDLHASLQAAGVDTESVRRELEADAAGAAAGAAAGGQAAGRMLPKPSALTAGGSGMGSSLFNWWQRWQQQQQQEQDQGLLGAVGKQQRQQQQAQPQPQPFASSERQ